MSLDDIKMDPKAPICEKRGGRKWLKNSSV